MKKLLTILTTFLIVAGALTAGNTAVAAEAASAVSVNEANEFHREQEMLAAKKLAEKLNGKSIVIAAKYGVDGLFFGSVTSKEIAKAIETEFGETVDKRKIEAPEIKKCGTYDIRINLFSGVVCNMTVVVE